MRPIGQVGTVERMLGIAILVFTGSLATAFVVQATSGHRSSERASDTAARDEVTTRDNTERGHRTEAWAFPDPGVPDWVKPSRVSLYTRENLHIKIDGQAPAYFAAGFVALRFGVYTMQGHPRRTVDVYCYDMGTSANAARMYRAEAAPGAATLPIGDEAYQIGGAVFLRQGAAYVQVLPGTFGEQDAATARAIAAGWARMLQRRDEEQEPADSGR